MADTIKCLVCGEVNAADQEFCQNCQSRLQPLTGPLKGADTPLRPGDVPTKKMTAELEPILPQWLRDARDKARQSAEEDALQAMQQQRTPSSQTASEPDLLAGLRSQARADDEEETPDWLANITGASPKSKKPGPESSEVRWVEVGGRNDFAQEKPAPEESEPSWLAGMPSISQDDEKDELKDWFRQSSGLDLQDDQIPSSDSSGWPGQPSAREGGFAGEQQAGSSPDASAPDWLRRMAAESDAGAASTGDVPSWLGSNVQEDSQSAGPADSLGAAFGGFEAGSASAEEVPGWMQGGDSQPPLSESQPDHERFKEFQPQKPDPPLRNTTPLWLKETWAAASPSEADTPAWLSKDTVPVSPPSILQTPVTRSPVPPSKNQPGPQEDTDFGDIPGWLKAAAPQSSIYAEPPAEETPVVPPEASGWLATFKSTEPSPSPQSSEDRQKKGVSMPAFTPDSLQDGGVDGLFTEMPDWLSSVSEPAPASGPSPAAVSDGIAPGDLPSWVQAMRPVDPGVSRAPVLPADQTLETHGVLSGLQGVLPAVPGFTPSSKPKVYSIKLQASQEQQSHAALLEQILAAETEPVPITSFSPLRRSRSLRWFISFIVFVLIFIVTALNTRAFSMPVGVPGEFTGAQQAAQNVPEGAAVLVAMDYHPARAGEMEAAAAPMFDQMLVLRHPRLTFISTHETGAVLAERFIAGTLKERGYQYGNQYLNLGYLPGGVMGIRAFTLNPPQAMPIDIFLNLAWATPPLQGVSSLSQFAALIVITDNADTARAWIEQSMSVHQAAGLPLIVVSSAQAAPMILPYYNSGQVSGIVNGLYGGAIFEQNNAGRPGTARNYWDAYSLGMLLAAGWMLGGGLWSAAISMRERAVAREGG